MRKVENKKGEGRRDVPKLVSSIQPHQIIPYFIYRKLYRRVDHENELNHPKFDQSFQNGLPVDGIEYRLNINYRFRVSVFN